MKRLFKVLLYVIGAVILLVSGVAAFIHFRGIPTYSTEKIDLKVEITPERVAKGAKLAAMLCSGCHLEGKTATLSGKWMADSPPEFGKVYSANITKDPTYGIGQWTDGEIAYLLRTGLRPDGQYIPPYMPKLVLASDEDIHSIIAFLRSDHPWVKAQAVPKTPTQASFLTKFLCTMEPAFKPAAYPKKAILAPNASDKLAFGEYLINLYDCYSCHSANFQTNDFLNPRKSKGYMGGGNIVLNLEGKKVFTANLTPDKETGIGNWSEAEFIKCLKAGKKPDGTVVKYPMLPYTQLEDAEAAAIYAYLKTVPAIMNKVPKN
jgi:mono/diheme cytochrome c family protein